MKPEDLDSVLASMGLSGTIYAIGYLILFYILIFILHCSLPKEKKVISQSKTWTKYLSKSLTKVFLIYLAINRYGNRMIPSNLTDRHIRLELHELQLEYDLFHTSILKLDNPMAERFSFQGKLMLDAYMGWITDARTLKFLSHTDKRYRPADIQPFLVEAVRRQQLALPALPAPSAPVVLSLPAPKPTTNLKHLQTTLHHQLLYLGGKEGKDGGGGGRALQVEKDNFFKIHHVLNKFFFTIQQTMQEELEKPFDSVHMDLEAKRKLLNYRKMSEKFLSFIVHFEEFHAHLYESAFRMISWGWKGGIFLYSLPDFFYSAPLDVILALLTAAGTIFKRKKNKKQSKEKLALPLQKKSSRLRNSPSSSAMVKF